METLKERSLSYNENKKNGLVILWQSIRRN